jgi:hydrogenase nickel incorporation protein HypA/HybF
VVGPIINFDWNLQMHELSVLKEVIRIVEKAVADQKLSKVAAIVLQVGELCGIYTGYLEELFPIAVHNTSMEGVSLKIQVIPANARCHECEKVFNVIKNDGTCPGCMGKSYEALSGREFLLKEIIAC